jgi:hypothetical protein
VLAVLLRIRAHGVHMKFGWGNLFKSPLAAWRRREDNIKINVERWTDLTQYRFEWRDLVLADGFCYSSARV